MQKNKKSKDSFFGMIIQELINIFNSEEETSKKHHKRSEYYQNPFGGFLP